jgi:drug/metabolite transporter (DMT)-like permease
LADYPVASSDRQGRPLAVPLAVHALVLAMAVVSTFVPVWCVAEALKRIDANTVALVGCLGPIFTIAFGTPSSARCGSRRA